MTRVETIRRELRSGQYRDYLTRNPAVLDRIVDEVAADVLREEMERGGEPLIRVGQGDYAEETDDPFDEVGRSSMCGGLEIVGWAILLAAAWAVACFW